MHVEADPEVITQAVREARAGGKSIGVVPTMGALHAGHVSLVEAAASECDFVVVTIFVNPTQFAPDEDLAKYPRTLEADLELCRAAGADVVFTPAATTMYPPNSQSVVSVSRISRMLEGESRPGHFDGVTTIVAKLFNITEPDRAYFGQKDFQQQLVVRQMVRDLNFGVNIVTCPIIREADGLAMSSRNRYLSPDERQTALQIKQSLLLAQRMASETQASPAKIADVMRQKLRQTPGINLNYAVVVDTDTLNPVTEGVDHAVALIAARVGSTRLIDNLVLQFR
jgi:pantoate--beta-alanine ligase